jgi:trk system potassium uptake protein
MQVIVVGCGRVGSTVAAALVEGGHDVCVIDRHASAFRRLGDDFAGRTLVGVGFDRDVLTEAGVATASAVLAVTSGDNSNILIARVARETFGIERVVARIYDPKRAEIYERLGIATVASVAWTSARALSYVLPEHDNVDWTDPTANFVFVERRITSAAAGRVIGDLEAAVEGRVSLLARDGQARLADRSLLLQQDDTIHLVLPTGKLGVLDYELSAHDAHEGGH